ncbi:conjugal transfer protein TraF [Candidatus Poribacteria bacterium]|jgi:hypothetical protein|nr:conjugal transfer protein TraF [Candidatus Poribacteria bacterium]MBT5531658.1 conjugal transfer protein TraF [Candidatus Poribacteria bacterium]MBT5709483.1 conjugal transfer protein TraF [Candidatus Poribacteria bacterium]MBT7099032.1 conjugal transfer protein TraF [Candidatus Poribacteria bacterium]MBT7807171.1 conjugal transfer protein TraF [Candidatus Poribacteria bacterium]
MQRNSSRMRELRGLLVGCVVASSVAVSAMADEPLLPFRSLRAMGLGNAYEAVADDLFAFDYNPAGLANIDRFTLAIVPAQARVSDDLAGEVQDLEDLLDEIDELSKQDTDNILASSAIDDVVARIDDLRHQKLKVQASVGLARVALPLPEVAGFRLVGGASVSNQLVTGINLNRAGLPWGSVVLDVLDDEFTLDASLEVFTMQFAAAAEKDLSTPFVERVRAGANLRLVNRKIKRDFFTLTDMLDPDRFKANHFDTTTDDGEIDSFGDIQDIIDNNTESETGQGVDVGVQVDHTDYLSTALVVRSLFSDVGDDTFPTTTTISAAAKPLTFLDKENSLVDLTVAAGFSDGAGDDAQEAFLNDSITDNIHLGAEALLFPNSPINLALRVGDNQGFSTWSAELKLAVVRVGVGWYGDLETDYWAGGMSLVF